MHVKQNQSADATIWRVACNIRDKKMVQASFSDHGFFCDARRFSCCRRLSGLQTLRCAVQKKGLRIRHRRCPDRHYQRRNWWYRLQQCQLLTGYLRRQRRRLPVATSASEDFRKFRSIYWLFKKQLKIKQTDPCYFSCLGRVLKSW